MPDAKNTESMGSTQPGHEVADKDFDPRNFALFASGELLSGEQAALVKRLSLTFMKNPDLLRSVQDATAEFRGQLNEEELGRTALASFGWSDDEKAFADELVEGEGGQGLELSMPSPKQAAAAVGAAVAAIAGGPGVAVAAVA